MFNVINDTLEPHTHQNMRCPSLGTFFQPPLFILIHGQAASVTWDPPVIAHGTDLPSPVESSVSVILQIDKSIPTVPTLARQENTGTGSVAIHSVAPRN